MAKLKNEHSIIKRGWIIGVILFLIGIIIGIVNMTFLTYPIWLTGFIDAALIIFNEYLTAHRLNTKGIRITLFIVGILMLVVTPIVSGLLFI